MLDYCEATGDEAFLRETVLPLADGVITFYDQHWKRDEKGKIRMDPACALESGHEVVNPLPEIAGLRYVLPRLLALPEKKTTAAQRAAWKKTLADVPEMPMATLKDAATPAQLAVWKLPPSERPEVRMSAEADKKILVAAEVIKTWQGDEVPDLYAVFPYRLYAFDSKDADIGRRTFERWNPPQPRNAYPWEGRIGGWRLECRPGRIRGQSRAGGPDGHIELRLARALQSLSGILGAKPGRAIGPEPRRHDDDGPAGNADAGCRQEDLSVPGLAEGLGCELQTPCALQHHRGRGTARRQSGVADGDAEVPRRGCRQHAEMMSPRTRT